MFNTGATRHLSYTITSIYYYCTVHWLNYEVLLYLNIRKYIFRPGADSGFRLGCGEGGEYFIGLWKGFEKNADSVFQFKLITYYLFLVAFLTHSIKFISCIVCAPLNRACDTKSIRRTQQKLPPTLLSLHKASE